MSSVIEDKSEWVFENSHSFIETDAMFSNITFGFCWIPLEFIFIFYSTSFCEGFWSSSTH